MKNTRKTTVFFDKISEALEAGYTRATREDRDVSGPNHFGYIYERNGQETVTVWFSEEENKIGQKGAFIPMFPPK